MDSLQLEERADEVRVRISGALNGTSVEVLHRVWQRFMSDTFWRRFNVDLSGLTGYDAAGESLLQQLYNWGAIFCAPTPRALQFLQEISRPVKSLIGSNYGLSGKSVTYDRPSDDLLDHVSMTNSLMRLSAQCNSFVESKPSGLPMRKKPARAKVDGEIFRKAAAS
jgi:ABC-type transporter Mla MlaB component